MRNNKDILDAPMRMGIHGLEVYLRDTEAVSILLTHEQGTKHSPSSQPLLLRAVSEMESFVNAVFKYLRGSETGFENDYFLMTRRR